MIDLELGTDGDIQIYNGDLVYITETRNAIAQFLAQRLKLILSEWFLDSSLGVPWFQEILIKNPNFEAIDAIIKKTIIETNGVTELVELNYDFAAQTREFSIEFTANTAEGELNFNEVIEI